MEPQRIFHTHTPPSWLSSVCHPPPRPLVAGWGSFPEEALLGSPGYSLRWPTPTTDKPLPVSGLQSRTVFQVPDFRENWMPHCSYYFPPFHQQVLNEHVLSAATCQLAVGSLCAMDGWVASEGTGPAFLTGSL